MKLTAPIRILVFAREPEFPRYRDRLDEYAYLSNQVTVDYIDVEKQPILTRQYEVQFNGTIVFDYEGRVERVVSDAEQDLTNGLITVIEGTEQTVYFLEGHGEKEHTSTDRDGYSTVSAALALDNFDVESLVLAQQSAMPEDATVLVVAGPQTDLLPGEVEALRVYLDRGGKLLVLIDPPSDSAAPEPDGLLGLLREWGIEPGTDVVVDASGMGQLLGADASVQLCDVAFPLGNLKQQRLGRMLFGDAHKQAARDAFELKCPNCTCKCDSRIAKHAPSYRRFSQA